MIVTRSVDGSPDRATRFRSLFSANDLGDMRDDHTAEEPVRRGLRQLLRVDDCGSTFSETGGTR
jgi:hypothetical protein